jgi:hypothetical protein
MDGGVLAPWSDVRAPGATVQAAGSVSDQPGPRRPRAVGSFHRQRSDPDAIAAGPHAGRGLTHWHLPNRWLRGEHRSACRICVVRAGRTVEDDLRPVPTSVTNSEGQFEIADLAQGTYSLEAHGPDGSKTVVPSVAAAP